MCWMFAPRTISVGRFYRMDTTLHIPTATCEPADVERVGLIGGIGSYHSQRKKEGRKIGKNRTGGPFFLYTFFSFLLKGYLFYGFRYSPDGFFPDVTTSVVQASAEKKTWKGRRKVFFLGYPVCG